MIEKLEANPDIHLEATIEIKKIFDPPEYVVIASLGHESDEPDDMVPGRHVNEPGLRPGPGKI